jgi:outer membrane protein assembly factor BamB
VNLRICICGLLFLAEVGQSEDWPNWRGPNFDGVTRETLPSTLPDEPKVSWRTKVGVGFSSVSVSRGRVFTMGNADETDTVWCLDADSGRVIWKHSYACALDPRFYEGGPGVTPTVSGDAVYTLSKKGHAFRFDFETGDVTWRRDLVKDHELEPPEWSFAGSPFCHDDLVVLNCGGAGIALHAGTGKTAWKSSAEHSGYATAVPFVRDGKTELLLFVAKELVSVEPATGRILWRFSSQCSRNVNAADPVVDGNRVMISSSNGSVCLQIQPGKNPEPKPVWEQKALRTYFNPTVRVGGYIYAISGTTHRPTELVCLDWKTGEIRWKEPGFGSGALMAAGDRLVIFDKGRLTICLATADGFAPLLQAQILGGKCWTAPVVANGRVFCRNAKGDLACVDLLPQ